LEDARLVRAVDHDHARPFVVKYGEMGRFIRGERVI
jgi:hypothetical protein